MIETISDLFEAWIEKPLQVGLHGANIYKQFRPIYGIKRTSGGVYEIIVGGLGTPIPVAPTMKVERFVDLQPRPARRHRR